MEVFCDGYGSVSNVTTCSSIGLAFSISVLTKKKNKKEIR
jgi:hypothetical protein